MKYEFDQEPIPVEQLGILKANPITQTEDNILAELEALKMFHPFGVVKQCTLYDLFVVYDVALQKQRMQRSLISNAVREFRRNNYVTNVLDRTSFGATVENIKKYTDYREIHHRDELEKIAINIRNVLEGLFETVRLTLPHTGNSAVTLLGVEHKLGTMYSVYSYYFNKVSEILHRELGEERAMRVIKGFTTNFKQSWGKNYVVFSPGVHHLSFNYDKAIDGPHENDIPDSIFPLYQKFQVGGFRALESNELEGLTEFAKSITYGKNDYSTLLLNISLYEMHIDNVVHNSVYCYNLDKWCDYMEKYQDCSMVTKLMDFQEKYVTNVLNLNSQTINHLLESCIVEEDASLNNANAVTRALRSALRAAAEMYSSHNNPTKGVAGVYRLSERRVSFYALSEDKSKKLMRTFIEEICRHSPHKYFRKNPRKYIGDSSIRHIYDRIVDMFKLEGKDHIVSYGDAGGKYLTLIFEHNEEVISVTHMNSKLNNVIIETPGKGDIVETIFCYNFAELPSQDAIDNTARRMLKTNCSSKTWTRYANNYDTYSRDSKRAIMSTLSTLVADPALKQKIDNYLTNS